jgi:hypothetical protein
MPPSAGTSTVRGDDECPGRRVQAVRCLVHTTVDKRDFFSKATYYRLERQETSRADR